MKPLRILLLAMCLVGLAGPPANAATITLFDSGTYINGLIAGGFITAPPVIDTDAGPFEWTQTSYTSGAGSYDYLLFLDYEIDELLNTYFNEAGGTGGVLAPGQSWEIDEPGYVFGDIYDNFLAGALDNSNGVLAADDVSMALGWAFDLVGDEVGVVTWRIATFAPTTGFYLSQFDPDSNVTLYFSSTFAVEGGGVQPVPEPATLLLLGAGLVGLARFGRRR